MTARVFRALPDEDGRNTVPTVTGTRVQRLRAIREALLASMGGRCAYCGCELDTRPLHQPGRDTSACATIDHILPVSRGGTDAAANLTLACRRCNVAKGDRTAEEFVDALNFDPALIAARVIEAWRAGVADMPGVSPRLRQHLPTMLRGIKRRAQHPVQHARAGAIADALVARATQTARELSVQRASVLAGVVAGLFDGERDFGLPAAVIGSAPRDAGFVAGFEMARAVVETRGTDDAAGAAGGV